jgi:cellulose synthase/poly-beta-1,6-N-acetylglucosamine synthase-like glycosyltransferase
VDFYPIWTFLGICIIAFTLPGTIEILLVTLGAICDSLMPIKSKTLFTNKKLAVVIPAYNEDKTIRRTIRSFKLCKEKFDIFVIADNCTDNTEKISLSEGVNVLRRENRFQRGKNHALHFAFTQLLLKDYEIFVVVDADSIVQANFISAIMNHFSHGADAVQVRYGVLDPQKTIRTKLMNIAFLAFNFLRPKGRKFFGLSVGILGNGFGLSRYVLKALPYQIESIVEDLAYHVKLVEQGFKVDFIEETTLLGEMANSETGSKIQHTRWEGGRINLIIKETPPLLKKVLKGKFYLLEPLLELLLLPLAYHCFLLIILVFLPLSFTKIYALFALGVVSIHVITAIILGGGGRNEFIALLAAPFYLIWKLTLLKEIFSRIKQNSPWERTPRNKK